MSRDDYLNRKIMKQLDEIKALESIHKKELSDKQTRNEVKKLSKYMQSSLYEIRCLDKESPMPYNNEDQDQTEV